MTGVHYKRNHIRRYRCKAGCHTAEHRHKNKVEHNVSHEYAKTNGINYSLIFDEREFGDINNDGKVDVNDVTHLQRYIAGFTDESGAPIIPDSDLGYADITDEGTIDSRDVTALQMILTNK